MQMLQHATTFVISEEIIFLVVKFVIPQVTPFVFGSNETLKKMFAPLSSKLQFLRLADQFKFDRQRGRCQEIN